MSDEKCHHPRIGWRNNNPDDLRCITCGWTWPPHELVEKMAAALANEQANHMGTSGRCNCGTCAALAAYLEWKEKVRTK